MRVGAFFAVVLVGVLGWSLGAQAAMVTATADKSTYSVGETITITIIGVGKPGEKPLEVATMLHACAVARESGRRIRGNRPEYLCLSPTF